MRSFVVAIILVVAVTFAVNGQDVQLQPTALKSTKVSYGLVVDNSGSYRLLLERVIDLASAIVELNGPADETFLLTFVDSEKISLRQDFTTSKSELHDAVNNMYIAGGATAILDAVRSAAEHMAGSGRSGSEQYAALVLITDGDERGSNASLESVLTLLKEEKIRLYAIGISDTKVDTRILDRLTKETGGRLFLPKKISELSIVSKELSAAIRAR